MKRRWFQNNSDYFFFAVIIMLSVFGTEAMTAGMYDYAYKGTALVSPPVNSQYERYANVIGAEGDKIQISCDFTDSKEHSELSSILIKKWEYNFWNGWNPEYSEGSAYAFYFFSLIVFVLLVIGVIKETKDQLAFNKEQLAFNIKLNNSRSISAIPVSLSQSTAFNSGVAAYYSQKSSSFASQLVSVDGWMKVNDLIAYSKLAAVSPILDVLPSPPTDIHGVIAYRRWNYSGGYLKSIGWTYQWKNKIEKTDPLHSNMYGGLHAYKINDILIRRTNVTGLVEMRGKVIEHSDGVLRSEWARILVLLCSGRDTCDILSKIYDVSAIVAKEGVYLTQEWMNKIQEGYRWVQVQL